MMWLKPRLLFSRLFKQKIKTPTHPRHCGTHRRSNPDTFKPRYVPDIPGPMGAGHTNDSCINDKLIIKMCRLTLVEVHWPSSSVALAGVSGLENYINFHSFS